MPDETPRITDDELAKIRRLWSRDGGMGNERSAADYSETGRRVLVAYAFRDVEALLAELDRLRAVVADQQTRLDAVAALLDDWASDESQIRLVTLPVRISAILDRGALAAGSGDGREAPTEEQR